MSSDISKRFVSESDIQEAKQKRQEEWERVRKPDQPLEAPEEEHDHRSLFERLEEQRVKKQEEWDEAHRLKNMVRGLENDEIQFLDFVSRRQEEMEQQRKLEEELLLAECKSSTLPAVPSDVSQTVVCKASSQRLPGAQRKSQRALLAGAVKRKNSESGTTECTKQMKECRSGSGNECYQPESLSVVRPDGSSPSSTTTAPSAGTAASAAEAAPVAGAESESRSAATANGGAAEIGAAATSAGDRGPPSGNGKETASLSSSAAPASTSARVIVNSCCTVVAILPGIGDYKDNSDDSASTSTSSDEDLDDLIYPTKPKVTMKRGTGGEGGEDNG